MPYKPKSGQSIFEFAKAATDYIEGKEVSNVNMSPIDTKLLDALRAKQRTRGQFVHRLDTWYKEAEANAAVGVEVIGTTIENYVSGFKRAAEALKISENVEILKDKDNNRVVLVKSA